jgi:hypothetical protein
MTHTLNIESVLFSWVFVMILCKQMNDITRLFSSDCDQIVMSTCSSNKDEANHVKQAQIDSWMWATHFDQAFQELWKAHVEDDQYSHVSQQGIQHIRFVNIRYELINKQAKREKYSSSV